MDAYAFKLGFALMVIAAIMKGLAHRKGLDGKHLIVKEETRGFLSGIAFIVYSTSLVITGVWYGANYIN